MREIIGSLKNMTILDKTVSLKSSLSEAQLDDIDALAEAIAETMPKKLTPADAEQVPAGVDKNSLFKLSYGLYILTAQDGEKDNGCIINTVSQLTDTPSRFMIAVNKQNYTHDMIMKTGKFNISVLTEEVPFKVFQHFGFQSGRDVDKFADAPECVRSANGVYYVPKYANAFVSGNVIETYDYGTHTLFIADVTQAQILSEVPSVTYSYYFEHIKPKPAPADENKKGFVCKICGYVYEGDELPADFICPLCKHGADDFEPLGD